MTYATIVRLGFFLDGLIWLWAIHNIAQALR